MKIRTKLLTAVGTLAIAGGMAAAPLSASAATVGAVVFTGATGNLTPPVMLMGGSGSYSFASTACIGVEATPTVAAGLCAIGSSGTYTNTVCGTGGASGSATVTITTGVGVGASITINYSITFVASVGLLLGSTPDGSTVVGVVQIAPTGGNCLAGVTQFTATGVTLAV